MLLILMTFIFCLDEGIIGCKGRYLMFNDELDDPLTFSDSISKATNFSFIKEAENKYLIYVKSSGSDNLVMTESSNPDHSIKVGILSKITKPIEIKYLSKGEYTLKMNERCLEMINDTIFQKECNGSDTQRFQLIQNEIYEYMKNNIIFNNNGSTLVNNFFLATSNDLYLVKTVQKDKSYFEGDNEFAVEIKPERIKNSISYYLKSDDKKLLVQSETGEVEFESTVQNDLESIFTIVFIDDNEFRIISNLNGNCFSSIEGYLITTPCSKDDPYQIFKAISAINSNKPFYLQPLTGGNNYVSLNPGENKLVLTKIPKKATKLEIAQEEPSNFAAILIKSANKYISVDGNQLKSGEDAFKFKIIKEKTNYTIQHESMCVADLGNEILGMEKCSNKSNQQKFTEVSEDDLPDKEEAEVPANPDKEKKLGDLTSNNEEDIRIDVSLLNFDYLDSIYDKLNNMQKKDTGLLIKLNEKYLKKQKEIVENGLKTLNFEDIEE